jgi:hypothetical protein
MGFSSNGTNNEAEEEQDLSSVWVQFEFSWVQLSWLRLGTAFRHWSLWLLCALRETSGRTGKECNGACLLRRRTIVRIRTPRSQNSRPPQHQHVSGHLLDIPIPSKQSDTKTTQANGNKINRRGKETHRLLRFPFVPRLDSTRVRPNRLIVIAKRKCSSQLLAATGTIRNAFNYWRLMRRKRKALWQQCQRSILSFPASRRDRARSHTTARVLPATAKSPSILEREAQLAERSHGTRRDKEDSTKAENSKPRSRENERQQHDSEHVENDANSTSRDERAPESENSELLLVILCMVFVCFCVHCLAASRKRESAILGNGNVKIL